MGLLVGYIALLFLSNPVFGWGHQARQAWNEALKKNGGPLP